MTVIRIQWLSWISLLVFCCLLFLLCLFLPKKKVGSPPLSSSRFDRASTVRCVVDGGWFGVDCGSLARPAVACVPRRHHWTAGGFAFFIAPQLFLVLFTVFYDIYARFACSLTDADDDAQFHFPNANNLSVKCVKCSWDYLCGKCKSCEFSWMRIIRHLMVNFWLMFGTFLLSFSWINILHIIRTNIGYFRLNFPIKMQKNIQLFLYLFPGGIPSVSCLEKCKSCALFDQPA